MICLWRKPCQLPGWMKNSSYYSATAEARTCDLENAEGTKLILQTTISRQIGVAERNLPSLSPEASDDGYWLCDIPCPLQPHDGMQDGDRFCKSWSWVGFIAFHLMSYVAKTASHVMHLDYLNDACITWLQFQHSIRWWRRQLNVLLACTVVDKQDKPWIACFCSRGFVTPWK